MVKSKQAASVQQELIVIKTVGINPKQSAPFLVPELNEDQMLAVVDEGVLKYLISLLPTAPFHEIKYAFAEKLRDTTNLKQMLAVIRQELVFHETCNLLGRYFDPKAAVTFEAPFNVPKPEPTFDEMLESFNALGDKIAEHKDFNDTTYQRVNENCNKVSNYPRVEPVEVAIPRTKDDDLYGGK